MVRKKGRIEVIFGGIGNCIGSMFGESEFKHVKMEMPVIHASENVK